MTISTGFGQTIDASIAVPGAISGGRAWAGQRGIIIRARGEEADSGAPLYARHGEALVFSAPNIARYRCQPDKITLSPSPGADASWVTGLLIATALPAALWMQRKFVLHASGIVPKGLSHAIAIAGPSRAGKSHLAAQLLELGASLLGDDSLALEVTDAGVSASGLPGGIHTYVGNSGERRFEPVAPDRSVISAPLGAIILLGGFAAEFDRMALNKTDAVIQIIANQHRPRIPAALGRAGAVLAQAAAIAEQVPVTLWRRSGDQSTLSPSELDALNTLLR